MKNKVLDARKRKGMRQYDLSVIAGIGQVTVSNVETGRYTPRVDVAIRIARALDFTVESLFIIE